MSPSYVTTADILHTLPKPETDEQYRVVFDDLRVLEERMAGREAVYTSLEARTRASQKIIDRNTEWLKESLNVG